MAIASPALNLTDTCVLFDYNRQPVRVKQQEVDQLKEIWARHPKEMYGVYQENPDLFRKLIPLWAHPGTLKGDILNDEQAKVILPLMDQATILDFQDCPNLTSACLPFLPPHAVHITTPQKTEYKHLGVIPGQVQMLFVYHIVDRTAIDGIEGLQHSKLDRLQMPGPEVEGKKFMQFLPSTLKILEIARGYLEDEDLTSYFSSQAGQLEDLYLPGVKRITAEAFKHLPNKLAKLSVYGCPSIEMVPFLLYTTRVNRVRHMTAEEVKKSQEEYERATARHHP